MAMQQYIYAALLVAIAAYAAWRGSSGTARAAVVVLANFIGACVWVLTMTQGYETETPWLVFLALNIASMVAVLWHPAARPQALVGALFLFSIMLDVAFGISGNDAQGYVFNSAIVGWAQLSILAMGAIDDDNGNSRIARWYRVRVRSSVQAYLARLVQSL